MAKTYSPSERDMQLSTLAMAYSNCTDARARNMIRGKAQKLVNQSHRQRRRAGNTPESLRGIMLCGETAHIYD